MLDQFHPCIQDFIKDIVYVKANGNYGYHVIDVLLGMGEEIHGLWFIIICGKKSGGRACQGLDHRSSRRFSAYRIGPQIKVAMHYLSPSAGCCYLYYAY